MNDRITTTMTKPTAPRVAASVSYTVLDKPPAPYVDYSAPDDVTAAFFELTSLDGRSGTAVLLTPDTVAEGAPLVISIHGSGGSIVSQPVHLLSQGLTAGGIPVLAVDTRQSGDAVNTDSFYATVRDIEAAFWAARDLGFDRIALHGHSLGTSQVAYFAATHFHSEIVGVVLSGLFADLPWKSRHMLINDEAAYGRLGVAAVEAAQAGDFGRILPEPMRWLGGRDMPVSAAHFLTYRQTGTAGARSIDWVARVPYPLLMVRDEHDPVINYFEPGQMERAALEGITPSVTSVHLKSEAGSNGHAFETSGDELVALVQPWLSDLAKTFR
jgi:pimeloyl-ACP methyl ester carboxylesterase